MKDTVENLLADIFPYFIVGIVGWFSKAILFSVNLRSRMEALETEVEYVKKKMDKFEGIKGEFIKLNTTLGLFVKQYDKDSQELKDRLTQMEKDK